MKNTFLCTLAMLLLFTAASAQVTVKGSCTEVTILGSIPVFDQGLYNITNQIGSCSAVVGNPGGTMKARMYLQRLDPSGQFVNVSSLPQYPPNNTWQNLPHGTFRVKVSLPKAVVALNCVSGWVNCWNLAGQLVGRKGNYPGIEEGENKTVFYSNAVPVGNTVAADNSYTFIDVPETGSETTYDYLEKVKINTADCKNYNLWWVAIFENGPNGRYNSAGWSNGGIPNNEVDLTVIWKSNSHDSWNFEPFRSYTVQFVVENQQCLNGSNWNDNNQDFFVCPAGTGCRTGEDGGEIAISPNPASTSIRLHNFEPDLGRDYRLLVTDLSGRAVRSVELTDSEVDITGLPSGMFVVSVLRDGQRVHSSKLVVNRP